MSDFFIQNFRGIRKQKPICNLVSEGVVSAITCQNVELKNTEDSSNVAIFTVKGNKCVKDVGKKVIGQFESVQSGVSYWFVFATDETRGYLYYFNNLYDELKLIDIELSRSNMCNGITISQGFDDWFVFTNGIDDYVAICMTLANEDDRVKLLNAVDAESRPIRGLGLEVQDGRLVTFCKNRVHWSAQANIFDWISSDSNVVTSPAYQEFDRDVTAIVYYNNSLVVFTSDYSVCFNGNPGNADTFSRSGATGGGTPSFKSVIKFDNKLFYYDNKAKNVFAYYLLDIGQTRPTEGLANNVIHFFEKIDNNRLNEIELISYIYGSKSEIWLKIPTVDDNVILIFDYLNAEWIERKAQSDIRAFAIIKSSFYSASGYKILKEYVGPDFDGVFVPSEYKMNVLNLNSDSNIKIPKMPIIMTLDFDCENDFYMEFVYDDIPEKSQKKHIVKLIKGYLIWSKSHDDENGGNWAINQDDENGGIWLSGDRNSVMFNLDAVRHFKRLQIRIYTCDRTQEFGIKHLEFKRIKFKTKSLG